MCLKRYCNIGCYYVENERLSVRLLWLMRDLETSVGDLKTSMRDFLYLAGLDFIVKSEELPVDQS
jgi:hypothetical protein